MATTQAIHAFATERQHRQSGTPSGLLVIIPLTVFAVLIHGYHPFAEDAGIYLPGVEKALHPELFPAWTQFVTVQSRFSLFSTLVSGLVRLSHLELMTVMFLIYVVTTGLTILAGWQIASRCWQSSSERFGAMLVYTTCLTIPVAGTSLLLMDPYVTARSISTPFGLLAISAAMRAIAQYKNGEPFPTGATAQFLLSLAIAGLAHPLMASYAAGCVLILGFSSISNGKLVAWLMSAVLALAVLIAISILWLAPKPSLQYMEVARTRCYWFLSCWTWYEQLGVIGPVVVLGFLLRRGSRQDGQEFKWVAQMGTLAGLFALIIVLLFARRGSECYAVAMLQPLRVFLTVYSIMLLALGAKIGSHVLQQKASRWILFGAALSAGMAFSQTQTFQSSPHVEFPWVNSANAWVQGFLWVRDHTPRDAVFAMDANYITLSGEDAQNFRAVAQRSALPDDSKDGGVAAIAPDLAALWQYGHSVQADLSHTSDRDRVARLHAASVQWLILPHGADTHLPCVYENSALRVCRVE